MSNTHALSSPELLAELEAARQRIAELEDLDLESGDASEQSKEFSEMQSDILYSVSDGIVSLDESMSVIFFNKTAEHLLGRKAKEVLGQRLFDAFPEARGSIFEEKYAEALRNKKFLCFEAYFGVPPYENWYDVRVFPKKDGISIFFQVTTERKQTEEALQQSEMHFRALVENAPFGIAITSAEDKVEYVNPMLNKLFGYGIEEVPDLAHWWPLAYPDSAHREETKALWENLVEQAHGESGGTGWLESRTTSMNGEVRDIEFTYTALGSRGLTTYFDVTERKRAEKTLRESEERYRLLADNVVDVVWFMGIDFKYVYVSPSIEGLMGYTPEEFKVLLHEECFTPASYELAKQAFAKRKEELAAGIVSTETKRFAMEQVRKDGSIVATEILTRVALDEKGKLVGFQGSTRDVTERKEAEEALRESESRFRAIFEQAAVGVAQIESRTGKFVSVNQKYCDIVGYSPEEMLEKTFQDITHPDDLWKDLDNMRRLMAGEIRTFTMEKRYYRKDGSLVWVNLTVSPMWGVGEEPNWNVAVVEDITERKRTEEAFKHRTYELGERVKELRCIYGISHLATDPNTTLPELFQKATDLIPPAWQYPEYTSARIIVESQSYMTDSFLETEWKQSSGIVAYGNRVGTVEVFYSKEMPECDEGPFLKEERALINAFSERLGKIIQRKEAEEALQKAHDELEQKIRDRTSKLKNTINQLVKEISQRKQAQGKFRAVIEQSGEGIALVDMEERFVLVNPVLCAMTGYCEEELLAMGIRELAPPEYELELFPRAAQGKSGLKEVELVRKDESRFLAEINGSPVDFGGNRYFLGITRDVTERKRLEQERRSLEEKYSKAFNSSLDSLTIATLNTGVLLEVNRGFELMTGYSRAEVVGKTIPELNLWWGASDREQFAETLQQQGSIRDFEVRIRSKSGGCIHGLAAAEIIHLEEGPCILASVRDVTERKKTEKVLQDNEKALKRQAKELEETNTALTVLLNRRDQEKENQQENALDTLRTLVFPFLKKLSDSSLSPDQESSLAIVTSNLNSIYSPFASRLAPHGRSLTPAEIHIAEFIRQGKSSKEIAQSLVLSEETIATHRKNIRAKFGILNQKVNLRTFLQSLEKEPRD